MTTMYVGIALFAYTANPAQIASSPGIFLLLNLFISFTD